MPMERALDDNAATPSLRVSGRLGKIATGGFRRIEEHEVVCASHQGRVWGARREGVSRPAAEPCSGRRRRWCVQPCRRRERLGGHRWARRAARFAGRDGKGDGSEPVELAGHPGYVVFVEFRPRGSATGPVSRSARARGSAARNGGTPVRSLGLDFRSRRIVLAMSSPDRAAPRRMLVTRGLDGPACQRRPNVRCREAGSASAIRRCR